MLTITVILHSVINLTGTQNIRVYNFKNIMKRTSARISWTPTIEEHNSWVGEGKERMGA